MKWFFPLPAALFCIGLLAACDAAPFRGEPVSRVRPFAFLSSSSSSSSPVTRRAVRTVRILLEDQQITPSVITVQRGENVRLQIVGAGQTRQFAIRGMGLLVKVQQGQTVTVGLPTHTTGTFSYACTPACGERDGQILIAE